MSQDFHLFAKAVNATLTELSKAELYTTAPPLDIFASYLGAFPSGTDPIFRERTEHDCSCCKNFIRNFGGVVSLEGGGVRTIWPALANLPEPYATVAMRMDALVRQLSIEGIFRTKESKYGAEHTYEGTHKWNHFWGTVAPRFRCSNPGEVCGTHATSVAMLRRAMAELTIGAVTTVRDLIAEGNLYRGEEHKRAVAEFQILQADYATTGNKEIFLQLNADKPAARFRNTAIGTLVTDLSESKELEDAVRMFESKVAPTNYKRTKALITPKMIDAALSTLKDLDLELAVERRYATIADISVNDVLFVNNNAKSHMKGGLRNSLMEAATVNAIVQTPKTIPITIDAFVTDVVPKAKTISVALTNAHLPNFMSLTAPVHENTGRLFQWDNDFAWSYDGEVTDSIKERVKKAGGNTNAPLRVSLAWHNYDDLDIHAKCPDGHIYFGNRKSILDVDMNAGGRVSREPVENLSWSAPRSGHYRIAVHNFCRREMKDVGFTLEIECAGKVEQYTSSASPGNGECVLAFEFDFLNGRVENFKLLTTNMHGTNIGVDKWGIKTQTFVNVTTLLNSPNHWENAGGRGAKHWFFILDGCVNPEETRGIYNEFLRNDLTPHRKVFEVLGTKTKCPPSPVQLSGLGFTLGRNQFLVATVNDGIANRTYNITF